LDTRDPPPAVGPTVRSPRRVPVLRTVSPCVGEAPQATPLVLLDGVELPTGVPVLVALVELHESPAHPTVSPRRPITDREKGATEKRADPREGRIQNEATNAGACSPELVKLGAIVPASGETQSVLADMQDVFARGGMCARHVIVRRVAGIDGI
jgi:hypothetical protein